MRAVDPSGVECEGRGWRFWYKFKICTLTPDTLASDSVKHWSTSKFDGTWRRGSTAGGCRNHPYTFWMNPQFKIKLEEEDDDPDDNEVGCSVVIGLIQKNRRQLMKSGETAHHWAMPSYEVPPQFQGQKDVHLDKNYFLSHAQKARSETFINLREVSTRFKLPPGEYLIVPSTFEPHKNGDFCVRVFSEKQSEMQQCDDPLAGDDMEISATELQTIFNKIVAKRTDIKTDGFSMETCRVMVNLMDESGNGKLGLSEFATLWKKIQKYLVLFAL
ncbi:hypothetical protein QQF64_000148 [Cirrhinus molitorella]|uniref:EF-hand domain-containing protein n=1 Tax=Cirrhinus molitorella TaxID=172907 RepID=A0ABR3NWT3_9TELE